MEEVHVGLIVLCFPCCRSSSHVRCFREKLKRHNSFCGVIMSKERLGQVVSWYEISVDTEKKFAVYSNATSLPSQVRLLSLP